MFGFRRFRRRMFIRRGMRLGVIGLAGFFGLVLIFALALRH